MGETSSSCGPSVSDGSSAMEACMRKTVGDQSSCVGLPAEWMVENASAGSIEALIGDQKPEVPQSTSSLSSSEAPANHCQVAGSLEILSAGYRGPLSSSPDLCTDATPSNQQLKPLSKDAIMTAKEMGDGLSALPCQASGFLSTAVVQDAEAGVGDTRAKDLSLRGKADSVPPALPEARFDPASALAQEDLQPTKHGSAITPPTRPRTVDFNLLPGSSVMEMGSNGAHAMERCPPVGLDRAVDEESSSDVAPQARPKLFERQTSSGSRAPPFPSKQGEEPLRSRSSGLFRSHSSQETSHRSDSSAASSGNPARDRGVPDSRSRRSLDHRTLSAKARLLPDPEADGPRGAAGFLLGRTMLRSRSDVVGRVPAEDVLPTQPASQVIGFPECSSGWHSPFRTGCGAGRAGSGTLDGSSVCGDGSTGNMSRCTSGGLSALFARRGSFGDSLAGGEPGDPGEALAGDPGDPQGGDFASDVDDDDELEAGEGFEMTPPSLERTPAPVNSVLSAWAADDRTPSLDPAARQSLSSDAYPVQPGAPPSGSSLRVAGSPAGPEAKPPLPADVRAAGRRYSGEVRADAYPTRRHSGEAASMSPVEGTLYRAPRLPGLAASRSGPPARDFQSDLHDALEQDRRRAADAELRHTLRSMASEEDRGRERLPHISELELYSPFRRLNAPVRMPSGEAEGYGSNIAGGTSLELHGRAPSIHEQMSATLKLEVRTSLVGATINRSYCWGWLEPGPGLRMLPAVLLEGAGVALGRGPEAFGEVRRAGSATSPASASASAGGTATPSSVTSPGAPPSPAGGVVPPGSPSAFSLISQGGAPPPSTAPGPVPPPPGGSPGVSPRSSGALSGDLSKAVSARWDAAAKGLSFVAIADGRVSRMHCTIRAHAQAVQNGEHGQAGSTPRAQGHSPFISPIANCPQGLLEDFSSNGTYVNGVRVPRPGGVVLKDGDRISLVQSVSPLVEQYFLYHEGDPRGMMQDIEGDGRSPSLTGLGRRGSFRLGLLRGPSPGSSPLTRRVPSFQLQRMMTSRYTTAETSTLEDLQCQICLGTLHQCVALEPCGHNFCAACLSNHFAAQLQAGIAISCPLRCPAPLRVVANTAVRSLVRAYAASEKMLRSTGSHSGRGHWANFAASRPRGEDPPEEDGLAPAEPLWEAWPPEGDGEDDGDLPLMSYVCPLHDEDLPMDASTLKSRQLEVAVRRLAREDVGEEEAMMSLEAIARLAWSDNGVRLQVAELGAIPHVIRVMRLHLGSDGVQCNACLTLMALVRGEGAICQANQDSVAQAGGVEAIVAGMRAWTGQAMVQLSALLAMIPLALENPHLQAQLAAQGLPEVIRALKAHPEEADVQAKGLVVLGVLGQGEEPEHDQIRAKEVAEGAPEAIAEALHRFANNEEVLWAALFSLAVLVRDGNPHPQAARAIVGRACCPSFAPPWPPTRA
eukprot:jgi/Botrbrau1/12820/Bobra.20_1s0011.1